MGKMILNGRSYTGGGSGAVELTKAQYDALTPEQKADTDKIYFVKDYNPPSPTPSGGGSVDDWTHETWTFPMASIPINLAPNSVGLVSLNIPKPSRVVGKQVHIIGVSLVSRDTSSNDVPLLANIHTISQDETHLNMVFNVLNHLSGGVRVMSTELQVEYMV